MSRIMPSFCSSVRPAAMLTVISGIFLAPCSTSWPGSSRPSTTFFIKQDVDARHKAGHDVRNECLSPSHIMPREYLAHLGDDLVLLAGELRGTALTPFLVGGDCRRGLGALDQVLDLHLAASLLVRALDDHAGRVAAVSVFELVAHVLRIAEIELGTDIRATQLRDHFLI